jgi:hypothetical protein
MRRALVVVALAMASATAHANSRAEDITASARGAALDGQCNTVAFLASEVQQIDPAYYASTFVTDPDISTCLRPPGMVAAVDMHAAEVHGDKDPDVALALSLGVTAGGYLAVALGSALDHDGSNGIAQGLASVGSIAAIIGPTTGHIYAGDTLNRGLGMRAGGLGLALIGMITIFSACPLFGDSCDEGTADAGIAILIGGGLLYVGGTIYEIATAPRSARRHNAGTLSLAPVPVHSGAGFALTGRF